MKDVDSILQQYFGYSSFRPLQKEIIQDILLKRDVFVLMPTGAGKSLCYQIPALTQKGVTIVVSPLISLMKDQVDGLAQLGVAAACINSTLNAKDQGTVKRLLVQGKLSLLYVAPERLIQGNFLTFLKELSLNTFAIDEAHCISEWGHDFRKEYRELSRLKLIFPHIPIAAFTATATSRVKQDIITHLGLKNVHTYQASFNRPNLQYAVWEKYSAFEQILEYLKQHTDESGIIYAQARDTVDMVADKLQRHGIKAIAYHAGLDDGTRKEHQEKFIQEDVDVVVATIAFGMGIDKPNVRFVIHYDLPANLERYYQETGRAGRDGLNSECILLYNYSDKQTIEYFIRQKQEQEQRVARHLLQQMVRFAESSVCRRKVLLEYFEEEWKDKRCNTCDNCLNPSETFDVTTLAQKILSCVYRVEQRFGIHHVIEVLRGSKTKKTFRLGHNKLSTYAILQDCSEAELRTYINELLQLGYLQLNGDQYPTVRLTSKSKAVLRGEEKVYLHYPRTKTQRAVYATYDVDSELFERLKSLRKQLADKQHIPPYLVFSDVTLQDMASFFPQIEEQFSYVKGVGEHKLKMYGRIFLNEICSYCQLRGIAPKSRLGKKQTKSEDKSLTRDKTVTLFRQGLLPNQIARKRNLALSTIVEHLEQVYLSGEDIDIGKLVSKEKQEIIAQAFQELGMERLAPAKEKLGTNYSYDELRLVRALLVREDHKL